MSNPFLRLTNVTKRYGDRIVVNNVSLSVAEGEVVALFGPSGCGKTTTLRIVAGLESPDKGEVWIDDKPAVAMPPRARGIGFVFQDLALWPHLTVAASLKFVLECNGVPKSERPERIKEALRLARIDRFTDYYPGQLSGGEQQRAAIARAIVARPRLLLFDEPLSNLDSDLKEEMVGEIASLQRLLGVTMIYVTHDRSEVATFATQVVTMFEGRILTVQ